MYPRIYENIDYGKLTDMTEDNKRLCKDLCKVGLCLTCFCGIYLIFFLGIINTELNINRELRDALTLANIAKYKKMTAQGKCKVFGAYV